jgi:hypothetical protein
MPSSGKNIERPAPVGSFGIGLDDGSVKSMVPRAGKLIVKRDSFFDNSAEAIA